MTVLHGTRIRGAEGMSYGLLTDNILGTWDPGIPNQLLDLSQVHPVKDGLCPPLRLPHFNA